MNVRLILLVGAALAAVALTPALEALDLDPAPAASAARCVMGDSGNCLIPVYCVHDAPPCGSWDDWD